MSFITIIDDNALAYLSLDTALFISPKKAHRHNIVIMSQTMGMWYRIICSGCSEDSFFETRVILNKILDHFETIGFKEVWSHWKKFTLPDNTYILQWKQ